MICNFYLSVAVRKIVCADPSLRYTRMLLGPEATNKQTNIHILTNTHTSHIYCSHLHHHKHRVITTPTHTPTSTKKQRHLRQSLHLQQGVEVIKHDLQPSSLRAGHARVVGRVALWSAPVDAQLAVVGDVGAAGPPERAVVLQPAHVPLAHAPHGTAGHDGRARQQGGRGPHHQSYLTDFLKFNIYFDNHLTDDGQVVGLWRRVASYSRRTQLRIQ